MSKYPDHLKTTKGTQSRVLYQVWTDMHFRCRPNDEQAKDYYLRGITVCDEWDDWVVFGTWALANGYRPSLQIDRINNDLGYSPSNCRFVTKSENMRNTRKAKEIIRLETGDVFPCQADCVEITRISRDAIRRHLKNPAKTNVGWQFRYI